MFIHDTLKELLICGETEIPGPKLEAKIKHLQEKVHEISGFETQFQVCL